LTAWLTEKTPLRLPQGVGAIVVTVFAMALTDAIIKLSSSGMTLWQIWVLRSAIVLPLLLIATRGRITAPEGSGNGTIWLAARSFALVIQYMCLYSVLPLMDLALAGAAFYTAPFFIVGLSAIVLGNRVTLRHWLAILTGCVGLLLIVRPFGADFTPLVLMPVAAAMFYATAAIITRARCDNIPPLMLALWLNLACGATGLILGASRTLIPAPSWAGFILGPWHSLSSGDWLMILALSVLIIGIAVGLAKAYQSPHPEVIATFDFSYMIFAVFWGFVFFGEVPGVWTSVGMALIIAGGLGVLMIRDGAAKSARRIREARNS
jgi:drug/metabolite transporter (DMT)-like permease